VFKEPILLSASEITGLIALPPTPLSGDGRRWDESNSVDLEEASRVADALARDGTSAIGLCGTTGECASLMWHEKLELYRTVADTVGGRVAIWAGTTALGTREVVAQMRQARDAGATGAFVGLPLWQTPTDENAVRFFADLSEALPDMPVLVYANRFFFKYEFGPDFWDGIVKQAPTVVATKVSFSFTEEHYRRAGHRVNFIAGEGTLGNQWRRLPESVSAAWATSAAMGPEPWVAFLDAHARGDDIAAQQAMADIESVPLAIPSLEDFAKYNVQFEKARINAAGYTQCGAPRPPYYDLPEQWAALAEQNGIEWAKMRTKYLGAARSEG
jgi:dihydrodipicolinate synthase/N-acetylneuraminate lyase